MTRTLTIALLTSILASLAQPARAQAIDPEQQRDPLNKIYFRVKLIPETPGPIRQMYTEMETIADCVEAVRKVLDKDVALLGNARAIDVECYKEKNVDKPS